VGLRLWNLDATLSTNPNTSPPSILKVRKTAIQTTLLRLDADGGESLVVGDRDVLNEREQTVLLVVTALAVDADANAARGVADALRPDEAVEGVVDADVLGAHHGASEVLDLAHSTGSALLEGTGE